MQGQRCKVQGSAHVIADEPKLPSVVMLGLGQVHARQLAAQLSYTHSGEAGVGTCDQHVCPQRSCRAADVSTTRTLGRNAAALLPGLPARNHCPAVRITLVAAALHVEALHHYERAAAAQRATARWPR